MEQQAGAARPTSRCSSAAHTFNLLDARGAISVTERAAYIGRIRNLARGVAQAYLDSRARLGLPDGARALGDRPCWRSAQRGGWSNERAGPLPALIPQRASAEGGRMSAVQAASLLVELLVEELPPKALKRLGLAFGQALLEGLQAQGLAAPGAALQTFASPRRLAALVGRGAAGGARPRGVAQAHAGGRGAGCRAARPPRRC
jgi:hypothetical protein